MTTTRHVASMTTSRDGAVMNRHTLSQSTLSKCIAGLLAAFWVGSAIAEIIDTPLPINPPAPQFGSQFGSAVAGVGDVNGDGIPDLLVGAPGLDIPPNGNQGQAYVLSGADRTLLRVLNNPTPEASKGFGRAVAGVGDIDGDGVPELLVGAPGAGGISSAPLGQAFIFSGATGTLLSVFNNPTFQFSSRFGVAVAGVGDINGDGVPDVVVGAPLQDVGANADQGQAWVMSGADGSVLLTLNDPVPVAFENYGSAVAGVGDVNGDGVPDVLVGAPRKAFNGFLLGQAFVMSGADGSPLLVIGGPATPFRGRFGTAVAGPGDIDGDGIPDLLIGAPTQTVGNNPFVQEGEAYVLSGADGSVLLTLNRQPVSDAEFGSALASLGDVDGDGVPDFVVGAPRHSVGAMTFQGRAFVLSGADGSLLRVLDNPSPQLVGQFAQSVAAVGDINGDGSSEVAVGTPTQDGTFFDQGQVVLFVLTRVIEVTVDIFSDDVNPMSHGVLPVVILTTPEFDAATVDVSSVRLGPDGAAEVHGEGHLDDVDGDGDLDLVLHFNVDDTGIACADTTATLTGKTMTGEPIQGSDSFVTVACP